MIKNIDVIKQDKNLVKVILCGIAWITEGSRVEYISEDMKKYVEELWSKVNKK